MPLSQFQKIGNASEVIKLQPELAKKRLLEILKQSETSNQAYIDFIVDELRKKNPFVDVVMLSEEGRVEGSWATLTDYAEMKTPPTIDDVLERVAQDGKMRYMAAPTRSSAIFYFESHGERLIELQRFEPHLYKELKYGTLRIRISMAHLPRIVPGRENPMSPGKLKNLDLALGKLGYWGRGTKEKTKQGIGFLAQEPTERLTVTQYIMRVYIEHPTQGFVYISPLQMADLLEAGMLPMDRPRKGKGPMLRIEAKPITNNAIVDFLLNYMQEERVRTHPLVLRFNAYRSWEGHYPKHP